MTGPLPEPRVHPRRAVAIRTSRLLPHVTHTPSPSRMPDDPRTRMQAARTTPGGASIAATTQLRQCAIPARDARNALTDSARVNGREEAIWPPLSKAENRAVLLPAGPARTPRSEQCVAGLDHAEGIQHGSQREVRRRHDARHAQRRGLDDECDRYAVSGWFRRRGQRSRWPGWWMHERSCWDTASAWERRAERLRTRQRSACWRWLAIRSTS